MTNIAPLFLKVYLFIETKHSAVQIEIKKLVNFWTTDRMSIKIQSATSLYHSILKRAGQIVCFFHKHNTRTFLSVNPKRWQNPESIHLEKVFQEH